MTKAIKTFEDFKLNKQLIRAVQAQGYTVPSPIQVKAIPLINAGHDVMGIAQTGTGKTAAFVLPILMKIKYAQDTAPRALILAPTRELAMQIEENVQALSANTDIRSVCLYGGVGPKAQMESISNGIDLLIATPGRFLDIYRKGMLITRSIKTLILDEADKMMDMGFMPQIRSILEVIPVKRQNLLFSATMPAKVLRLAEEFLAFPEMAVVTPQASTASTVKQYLYVVPNFKTKINLLGLLLEDTERFHRVLVFAKTKQSADNIFKFLSRKVAGNTRVIHSNKGQNTRINAIEEFKSGKLRILVATDVAARGIDVSQVSHVINFDVPQVYEDYVHRIGRTGRADHIGEAITFVIDQIDPYHVLQIEKLIGEKIPTASLPKGLVIDETSEEESKAMARILDQQRKSRDPTFKGAFHPKKSKARRPAVVKSKRKRRRN
ncbi:MAG: DEAD/DEAH box helicase [Cyclobacteriaceae bacterium]